MNQILPYVKLILIIRSTYFKWNTANYNFKFKLNHQKYYELVKLSKNLHVHIIYVTIPCSYKCMKNYMKDWYYNKAHRNVII